MKYKIMVKHNLNKEIIKLRADKINLKRQIQDLGELIANLMFKGKHLNDTLAESLMQDYKAIMYMITNDEKWR